MENKKIYALKFHFLRVKILYSYSVISVILTQTDGFEAMRVYIYIYIDIHLVRL